MIKNYFVRFEFYFKLKSNENKPHLVIFLYLVYVTFFNRKD